jgi:hypothetical protein
LICAKGRKTLNRQWYAQEYAKRPSPDAIEQDPLAKADPGPYIRRAIRHHRGQFAVPLQQPYHHVATPVS